MEVNGKGGQWKLGGKCKWGLMEMGGNQLDQGHQRYKGGLKMGPSAHCRVLLHKLTSDLDSWNSVDAKNGVTCQDWTKDTRDTKWVLKWVLVGIAAFCCRVHIRFGFLRFCRCKKWCHMLRLDQGHQRYRGGLKMGPSAHCRVLLRKPTSY